jgi:energy-coupling factor transport system ATP-binding protein
MIKFSNVSYTYRDGTTALKDINLHFARGERVTIVGSNGSGKTTLALLINGILRTDSGIIEIDGLDPSKEDDNKLLKRRVGLVFQNPDNQLVSTTVEREIAFSLENMNVPPTEMKKRVGRAMDLFGLSQFYNRLTSDMSGGEKQRLALAAVMVAEPEILILDEPGSYLDESGKRLLDDAITRLLDEKKDLTVLRITQYSDIAAGYNRMIVFDDGRIVGDDKPSAIFSHENADKTLGIEIPLKYRIKKISERIVDSPQRVDKNIIHKKDMKSIRVNSVSFNYDVKQTDGFLFENIDLEFESNKVYGLVGPSGSGKTTLIQLMAGLLKPLRGKISYSGFQARPGDIAIAFQQSERQFFLETVDREIKFGAENLARKNIEKIVDNCYSLIGLDRDHYGRRNPFTLSGGEKRRVAFGAILSLEPVFIFFDEPTCALDHRGIELFERLVTQLKNDGVGVVIISHYGNIIFKLADEVIVLNRGRVESVDSKINFFKNVDYSGYLSRPELVSFQLEEFGEFKYFTEEELVDNM